MTIVTVGIDFAKNVFALHEQRGKAVFIKPKVARSRLFEMGAHRSSCLNSKIVCRENRKGVTG